MNPNLEVLREEIPEAARKLGLVVFRGIRTSDERPTVEWDTRREPGYEAYLESAASLGVKVIVFRDQEFQDFMVEGALEDLEDAEMAYDERRQYEQQLREFRHYGGFTCAIEISFDHQGTLYLFELRTEWFREFQAIADEVSAIVDGGEESPLGGYYSNN
jgi:hypothetical protein